MAIKLVDIKYCITCGGISKCSTTDQGFSCCKVILSDGDDCKAKLNDYSMNGQMEYCYMCGHRVTTEKDVVFCNDCTETAGFDPPKISIKRSDIQYCPLCSKQLCQSKSIFLCKNCSCRIPINDDGTVESRLVEYCNQGKVRFCYSCGSDVTTNGEFVIFLKKECLSKLPLTKALPIEATSSKASPLPTWEAQPASSRPDIFLHKATETMKSATMASVTSSETRNAVPLAQMLKTGYKRILDAPNSLLVYQILAYPVATVRDQKVNRVGICEEVPNPTTAHKVIMLLGETGSGKTTLLNFLANYILDVKWEDPFRFVLVPDGEDETKSQTQRITAYTFHCVPGSNLTYNFTVIDTPGFGDSRGIETDKLIVKQIREFFKLPSPFGIDHLDGIALVVKAHGTRLTAMQRCVFTSLLSLFGKDLEKNIFILATHADDSVPTVIDALKECDIPGDMSRTLKFNNNTLFLSPEKRGSFSELYWKMGVEGAKNLFSKLQAVKGVSLTMTKEVLMERRQLEEQLKGMQEIIHEFMAHISTIEQETKALHLYQETADASKNYTFLIDVHKQKAVSMKPGLYDLNCIVCHFTCQRDCTIPDDGGKYMCEVMKPQTEDSAICTVCPNQCRWECHRSNDFRYEIYIEKETCTYEDLKRRYEESMEGKYKKEALLKQLENEKQQYEKEVQKYITNAYTSIRKLEKIALKPNPLSEVEYIELLIETEKRYCTPGFKERVNQYERAREKAILLREIKKNPNVNDLMKKKLAHFRRLFE